MTKLRTWSGPFAPILIGLAVFAAMYGGSELLDRAGGGDVTAGGRLPGDAFSTEEAPVGPGVPLAPGDAGLPEKPIPSVSRAAAPTATTGAGPALAPTAAATPTATTPGPPPPVTTTAPAPLSTTADPVQPPPPLPTDDLVTPPGKPVAPELQLPGLGAIVLGALCEDFGEFTVSDAGQLVVCITTATDAEYRWRPTS